MGCHRIIVGIIGETRWGRVMGKTRILDALATWHLTTRAGPTSSPASWKPSW